MPFGKLVNGGEDRLVFVSFFAEKGLSQFAKRGRNSAWCFYSLINSIFLGFATDYLEEL